MQMEQTKIKLYARQTENGVDRLLNTIFNQDEIKETDILIGEGNGDAYAHPQTVYELFDFEGLHNYKIVESIMTERTETEKTEEKAKIPAPPLDNITKIEREITELDIQNIETEQNQTELDLANINLTNRIKKLEEKVL